jgi:hypothetical protein
MFDCDEVDGMVKVSMKARMRWTVTINGVIVATAAWNDSNGFTNIVTTKDSIFAIVRKLLDATEKELCYERNS